MQVKAEKKLFLKKHNCESTKYLTFFSLQYAIG